MSTFLDLEWSSGYIIESIKAKCRVAYVICYLSWREGRKVKNIWEGAVYCVCVSIEIILQKEILEESIKMVSYSRWK